MQPREAGWPRLTTQPGSDLVAQGGCAAWVAAWPGVAQGGLVVWGGSAALGWLRRPGVTVWAQGACTVQGGCLFVHETPLLHCLHVSCLVE